MGDQLDCEGEAEGRCVAIERALWKVRAVAEWRRHSFRLSEQDVVRENVMNTKKAVTLFGTDAVIEYRAKAAVRDETRIPETCLSLYIASRMITDCNWDARVEVPYSRILGQLGVHGTDVGPKFGGLRADIAIYEKEMPSAIIEIKIFDEGRRPTGVVSDWQKIARLQSYLASRHLPGVPGYVGALVSDVEKKPAKSAVEELSQVLSLDPSTVDRGVENEASAGAWKWLFVCAELAKS